MFLSPKGGMTEKVWEPLLKVTNPPVQELKPGCNTDVVGVNGCSHSNSERQCLFKASSKTSLEFANTQRVRALQLPGCNVSSSAQRRHPTQRPARPGSSAWLLFVSRYLSKQRGAYWFFFGRCFAKCEVASVQVCKWKLVHLMSNVKLPTPLPFPLSAKWHSSSFPGK